MSYEIMVEIADKSIPQVHITFVSLFGGEPLLWKKKKKVIEKWQLQAWLKNKRMKIIIVRFGYNLDWQTGN